MRQNIGVPIEEHDRSMRDDNAKNKATFHSTMPQRTMVEAAGNVGDISGMMDGNRIVKGGPCWPQIGTHILATFLPSTLR